VIRCLSKNSDPDHQNNDPDLSETMFRIFQNNDPDLLKNSHLSYPVFHPAYSFILPVFLPAGLSSCRSFFLPVFLPAGLSSILFYIFCFYFA